MFDERLNKKEKLSLVILGIVIILGIIISNIEYNKAVETCINGGQDRYICETGLK